MMPWITRLGLALKFFSTGMPSHQAAREKRRSEPDGDIDYILGHARGFREATEPQNRLGAD